MALALHSSRGFDLRLLTKTPICFKAQVEELAIPGRKKQWRQLTKLDHKLEIQPIMVLDYKRSPVVINNLNAL